MKTTCKTLEQLEQAAAASASEPIFPAVIAEPEKSRRLRSGLLLETPWLVRTGLMELVSRMMERSSVACKIRSLWLVREHLKPFVILYIQITVPIFPIIF
jgi:hypothetical protein